MRANSFQQAALNFGATNYGYARQLVIDLEEAAKACQASCEMVVQQQAVIFSESRYVEVGDQPTLPATGGDRSQHFDLGHNAAGDPRWRDDPASSQLKIRAPSKPQTPQQSTVMEFRLGLGTLEFNAYAIILAPSNNSPVCDPVDRDVQHEAFWNLNVCGQLQFGAFGVLIA